MEFAKYRKFVGALVMGALMFAMNRYGIKPEQLSMIGLSVGDVQAGILDFLQIVAIPAVVGVLSQPNELGRSILDYWRWIVCGLAAIAAIGAVVVLMF